LPHSLLSGDQFRHFKLDIKYINEVIYKFLQQLSTFSWRGSSRAAKFQRTGKKPTAVLTALSLEFVKKIKLANLVFSSNFQKRFTFQITRKKH
jgi:hypothetical protein